jgi:hypothetical protein
MGMYATVKMVWGFSYSRKNLSLLSKFILDFKRYVDSNPDDGTFDERVGEYLIDIERRINLNTIEENTKILENEELMFYFTRYFNNKILVSCDENVCVYYDNNYCRLIFGYKISTVCDTKSGYNVTTVEKINIEHIINTKSDCQRVLNGYMKRLDFTGDILKVFVVSEIE